MMNAKLDVLCLLNLKACCESLLQILPQITKKKLRNPQIKIRFTKQSAKQLLDTNGLFSPCLHEDHLLGHWKLSAVTALDATEPSFLLAHHLLGESHCIEISYLTKRDGYHISADVKLHPLIPCKEVCIQHVSRHWDSLGNDLKITKMNLPGSRDQMGSILIRKIMLWYKLWLKPISWK